VNLVITIINIVAIVLYAMTVIYIYNKHTEYFCAMLIILIYWAQLLVSSAYIETGVYLKDIGTTSYATGATFRLFLQIELMLGVITYWAKKMPRKIESDYYVTRNDRKWLHIIFAVYAYRLLDIIISGNVLTNSAVTRFNYFSDYSKLPLAQIIDYFSYPLLWVAGYFCVAEAAKKKKILPLTIFVLNLAALFLRGIQFGGYLQCVIYFLSPLLLKLAQKRKLLKFRYIALATCAIVIMLIPKYNHFAEVIKAGNADTSYGLSTAYDFLTYRALAQEADLTWAIDRQVVESRDVDPGHYFDEMASILGIETNKPTGAHYLMNRGCSKSALTIYSYGTAAVTGGYPVIWAAMFGYIGAIPFLIIDASLLSLLLRCICEGLQRRNFLKLLVSTYLLCQCYTIVISANFSAIGNIIPLIFILFLLLLGNKKIVLRNNKDDIKKINPDIRGGNVK